MRLPGLGNWLAYNHFRYMDPKKLPKSVAAKPRKTSNPVGYASFMLLPIAMAYADYDTAVNQALPFKSENHLLRYLVEVRGVGRGPCAAGHAAYIRRQPMRQPVRQHLRRYRPSSPLASCPVTPNPTLITTLYTRLPSTQRYIKDFSSQVEVQRESADHWDELARSLTRYNLRPRLVPLPDAQQDVKGLSKVQLMVRPLRPSGLRGAGWVLHGRPQ